MKNNFETLAQIGEGAYGTVFKAKNRATDEIVAIKVCRPKGSDESELRKIVQREVKMLKLGKSHENIISLKEAFCKNHAFYLVFEFVECTVIDLLEERNFEGLEPELCRKLIFDVVKALDYCHSQNVIHRDIKPENLLVQNRFSDPIIKVCDFGFARHFGHQNLAHMTGYVATRWYRSPELLLSDPHYTTAVDMWSVGCLLIEMLIGKPVFPGKNEIHQLQIIQELLGPLTNAQQRLFTRNDHFLGFPMPVKFVSHSNPFLDRYGDFLSKDEMAFILDLIRIEPLERLSARQALLHPYFAGLNDHFIIDPPEYQFKQHSRRKKKKNPNAIPPAVGPSSINPSPNSPVFFNPSQSHQSKKNSSIKNFAKTFDSQHLAKIAPKKEHNLTDTLKISRKQCNILPSMGEMEVKTIDKRFHRTAPPVMLPVLLKPPKKKISHASTESFRKNLINAMI